MRLFWNHVWRSQEYRRASADERRLIEIRFCLARTLQRFRKRRRVTQKALAQRLRIAQASISRAERASNCVSLDIGVRCLIALGCSDAEISAALDPSRSDSITVLRKRSRLRRYPAPRDAALPSTPGEHRFLRKGTRTLRRML
jgi:transcriptional regulator with XRE-family HTH domain